MPSCKLFSLFLCSSVLFNILKICNASLCLESVFRVCRPCELGLGVLNHAVVLLNVCLVVCL